MDVRKKIWLSHTGIELLERCPRCFWLYYRKEIRQPEGIVSRLANRFDVVLKNYFNSYRMSGQIPPLIKGKIEGLLENPFQEKYFLPIDQNFGFYGKLDECLIDHNGNFIPVDFKTASSDPRDRETLAAYQSQIDDYIYLLYKHHKSPAGFGYLIYFYPDRSFELHHGFPMIVHIAKLTGETVRTEKRIKKAIDVLNDLMPNPSENCSFCNWYDLVKGELSPKVKNKSPKSYPLLDDLP